MPTTAADADIASTISSSVRLNPATRGIARGERLVPVAAVGFRRRASTDDWSLDRNTERGAYRAAGSRAVRHGRSTRTPSAVLPVRQAHQKGQCAGVSWRTVPGQVRYEVADARLRSRDAGDGVGGYSRESAAEMRGCGASGRRISSGGGTSGRSSKPRDTRFTQDRSSFLAATSSTRLPSSSKPWYCG